MDDEPAGQYWVAFWASCCSSVLVAGGIWVAEPTQFRSHRTAWAWFSAAGLVVMLGFTVLRTRRADLDDDEWLRADVRTVDLRHRITEPVATLNRFVVRTALGSAWILALWLAANDGRWTVTGPVIGVATAFVVAGALVGVRRRKRSLARDAAMRPIGATAGAVHQTDESEGGIEEAAPARMPTGKFLGKVADTVGERPPFGH